MGVSRKERVIDKLRKKGLITKEVESNLFMTFDDYMDDIATKEVELLEEVSRINEKRKNNQPLSFLEKSFWEYFIKTYKV